MQPIIRQANEQDYEQVLNLIKEFATFQGTPEKVTITVDQMRTDKGLFNCFVAETNEGNIIGFASYFFCYYSWTGKAIYMDDLYVQVAHRATGIGTQLLHAVTDHGQRHSCYKLRWQVSRWNQNAIEFYKSIGAEVDEVEINCDIVF